jgi:hypothetical protein
MESLRWGSLHGGQGCCANILGRGNQDRSCKRRVPQRSGCVWLRLMGFTCILKLLIDAKARNDAWDWRQVQARKELDRNGRFSRKIFVFRSRCFSSTFYCTHPAMDF